jgi:hypothetical protein
MAYYFTYRLNQPISVVEMKKKSTNQQHIKVKLDEKRTVVLNKMSSFKVWKVRYPFAKITN